MADRHQFIEFHPSDNGGGTLGRHVQHDEQSKRYAFSVDITKPVSITHQRLSPILDQDAQITFENVTYNGTGSCTGNASVGDLGTVPIQGTYSNAPTLDEALALNIYSAATHIDGYGAPFPTNDRGSSGLAVAKVTTQMGLIAGYQHCFSLDSLIKALQVTPVIIGSNWYDSMDRPNAQGIVGVSAGASVRGGHEYECIGVNVESQMLEFVNSWGSGWGLAGHFFMSYDTVTRLLGEQGDVTVFVPKTSTPPQPQPTPTPTPPSPPPPPQPTPTPTDVDRAMWEAAKKFWAYMENWAHGKGLS